MKKKAAISNGMLFAMFAIFAVVILGGIYMLVKPTTLSTGSGNNGGGTIVTTSTTLSTVLIDLLNPGTATSGTNYISRNGGSFATGITTGSAGDKLDLFVLNGSGYHSGWFPGLVVPAASTFDIPGAGKGLYKNASVTVAVYNSAKSAMTNGGGTNQTVSTGSAPTMELDMTGTSQASTQDMVCILEGSNSAKINKLVLNGFGATFQGVSKPASYTLAATTSAVWVYDVPAIADASLRTGSIYAESKTGQSMAGTYFIIDCFTKEHFIDSLTGQHAYAIEDSQGTLKSIAHYKFTGYFQ